MIKLSIVTVHDPTVAICAVHAEHGFLVATFGFLCEITVAYRVGVMRRNARGLPFRSKSAELDVGHWLVACGSHCRDVLCSIFCSVDHIMDGNRRSKEQRRIDRVSAAVWETLKRTSTLEELEEELSEEEFYTPPGSPSQINNDFADGPVRFGGCRVHTPVRAERLLGLHERICI